MTGLDAKALKEKRKVGLIVTHLTERVAISLVVALTERKEVNTHHAGQPQGHAKKKVRVNLGAKKLQKEKNNETNRIKIETINN